MVVVVVVRFVVRFVVVVVVVGIGMSLLLALFTAATCIEGEKIKRMGTTLSQRTAYISLRTAK